MAIASRITGIHMNGVKLLDYPGPDEKNVPPERLEDYVLVLYGPKGSGKTTAASSFPGYLTLMAEPRRRGLPIRMVQLERYTAKEIRDGAPDVWKQIVATTQRWIDDKTVRGLNFDSIDVIYDMCYHSVCARYGVSHPGDLGRDSSSVWNEIRDEFAAYFDALKDTGLGITMISHVKEREEVSLDSRRVGVASPSCTPQCLKYIKQAADIVLFLGMYNSRRAAMVRDDSNGSFVSCGVHDRFLQPDGKPVCIFEMPDMRFSNETPYSRICDAFNNKLWDMDTPEDDRKESRKRPVVRKAANGDE